MGFLRRLGGGGSTGRWRGWVRLQAEEMIANALIAGMGNASASFVSSSDSSQPPQELQVSTRGQSDIPAAKISKPPRQIPTSPNKRPDAQR